MRTKTVKTAAGDLSYNVEVQQFETLDEAFEVWSAKGLNPQDTALGIINSAQEQGAKQGGKTPVRKALKSGKDEEIEAAVTTHQQGAAGFIVGAPRGSTGGVTAKARKELGTAVVEFRIEQGRPPNEEEMEAIAADLGINF